MATWSSQCCWYYTWLGGNISDRLLRFLDFLLVLVGAELIFFIVAGAVFWTCNEKSVYNIGIFLLLLHVAHTELRFSCSSKYPAIG